VGEWETRRGGAGPQHGAVLADKCGGGIQRAGVRGGRHGPPLLGLHPLSPCALGLKLAPVHMLDEQLPVCGRGAARMVGQGGAGTQEDPGPVAAVARRPQRAKLAKLCAADALFDEGAAPHRPVLGVDARFWRARPGSLPPQDEGAVVLREGNMRRIEKGCERAQEEA